MLEEPDIRLLFGVWKYCLVAEIVVATPSFAFSAVPSASDTMYAGTVGSFGMPPRAIAAASPPTLFTTSTATAPASCAFRIFSENVQTPREISAISPTRLPAAGLFALHAVLSPLGVPVPVTTPNDAVRSAATVGNSPATAGTLGRRRSPRTR